MNEQRIIAKVDVKKLLKEHFFQGKVNKEGHAPLYVDLMLIPTSDSKYGDDFFIVQSVNKEARERGERGPIVGNAKYPQQQQQAQPARTPTRKAPDAPPPPVDADEDVPF